MKWIKSLATIALMGIPAWVILAGVLRYGPATVVVHVEDPGVEVRLGGLALRSEADARTFGPVEVAPGKHRLSVESDGVTVFEREITVGSGEPSEVWVRWEPSRPSKDEGRAIPGLEVDGLERSGHASRITGVGSSGDGRTVLSSGADGMLKVWDATTGAELRSVEAHMGVVQGLTVLCDGVRAVTVGDDQVLRVWDPATGAELQAIETGADSVFTCTAACADGRLVAVGTTNGQVLVFDLATGRRRHLWTLPRSTPGGVAFSPDGRTLLVTTLSSNREASPVLVYDTETGRLVRELRGHKASVWGVAFLPDGRRAVTGGSDRTLRLWDVTAGKELKRFDGHPGAVLSVAVSRDGRYALAGTGHQWSVGWSNAEAYGAHVWDLEDGQAVGRLETPGPIRSVAFSPDGHRALAGGEDRMVRWWVLPEAVMTAHRTRPVPESKTASRVTTVVGAG